MVTVQMCVQRRPRLSGLARPTRAALAKEVRQGRDRDDASGCLRALGDPVWAEKSRRNSPLHLFAEVEQDSEEPRRGGVYFCADLRAARL